MDKKVIISYFLLTVFLNGCLPPRQTEFTSYDAACREFRKEEYAKMPQNGILTLKKAQETALKNNPDYKAAYQSVLAAKYRYYRALGAYLPEVNGSAGTAQSLINGWSLKNPPDDVFPRENQFRASLALEASWLVFDGLAREFEVLARRAELRKAAAADENMRRLLLRAVAYAYYDAILAKEYEKIARANLSFQNSSLKQAQNRFQNGLVSKAIVLNFKILADRSESMILSAQDREKTARYALCALMGFPEMELPEKAELESLPIPEEKTLLFSLEMCLDTALQRRPDLAGQRFILDIARYNYYGAWSVKMPSARIFAGIGYHANESQLGGADVGHSHYETGTFTYGIRAGWNIFRGFSDWNRIQEFRILEQLSHYRLQQTFLKVVNEVKDAYVNYHTQFQQIQIYRRMLKSVLEQRQLVRLEYWSGKTTITRLNEAQSEVVDAAANLAIVSVRFHKAVIQLNAAVNAELRTLPSHEYPQILPTPDTILKKIREPLFIGY